MRAYGWIADVARPPAALGAYKLIPNFASAQAVRK